MFKMCLDMQEFWLLVAVILWYGCHLKYYRSGPDWSWDLDQIGLFLKIDLATGNHVSQYQL